MKYQRATIGIATLTLSALVFNSIIQHRESIFRERLARETSLNSQAIEAASDYANREVGKTDSWSGLISLVGITLGSYGIASSRKKD